MWPLESGFYRRCNARQLRAVDLNRDGSLDLISANNNEEAVLHLGLGGRQTRSGLEGR